MMKRVKGMEGGEDDDANSYFVCLFVTELNEREAKRMK